MSARRLAWIGCLVGVTACGDPGRAPAGAFDAPPEGPPALDAGLAPTAPPDAGPVEPLAACGWVDAAAEPQPTPEVWLVVDRSGSMTGPFAGSPERTRWDVLFDALFAPPGGDLTHVPGGVVRRLEDRVRFGLTLYTSSGAARCPLLLDLAPELDQAKRLAALYEASPPPVNGMTPTGEAIDAVVARVEAQWRAGAALPDALVLATDGDPDRCDGGPEKDAAARAHAVGAVERAHALGVPTYVLALGEVHPGHVQALADVGQGRAGAEPPAPFWKPDDVDGLTYALDAMVSRALGCELAVEGVVDPQHACLGVLTLDGRPLACDAPGSGWRPVDTGRIELLGEACVAFRTGAVTRVEAELPCPVALR